MKRTLTICPALLSVLLCAFGAMAQRSQESQLQRSIRTMETLLERLQATYVDSLDMEKHLQTGVAYMLRSLDPYTEYYTEEQARQFQDNSAGEYGGIGIRIATYNGQAYLINPMPGQPAFKAGLRSGDKVVRVDSTSTRGHDSNFVTKLIRGQAGTPVTITVVRPYAQDSLLTVTMERAKVSVPAVPFCTILPSGIGYLPITTFSPDNTAAQVRAALEDFKQDKNLKGIIIDLTENGGGLLSQAVDIASMFLPRGSKVLETKGRMHDESVVYNTKKDPIFPDIPLVVMLNRGSASASEVLAGALQDYDRAVLVGERSFGKGLVQSTMGMPYDGMLKVTTAKYYIPSGRLIQALDYSHRDADGHPGYTPDSLAKTYYTAAGRPVKDGGGLQPEVVVKDTLVHSYLVYNLVSKPYLFDFANRWHATHKQKEETPFVMTDEVWKGFVETLPDSALNYETGTSQALKQLRDQAKDDGLLTDAMKKELDNLEALLKQKNSAELAQARNEIERMLAPMLAERYGFEEAELRMELNYNPLLKAAEEVLLNPKKYHSLLKKEAPKKAPKNKKKK